MGRNFIWKRNVALAYNVLQLGAVCVGLCEGNCAKVLLAVWVGLWEASFKF